MQEWEREHGPGSGQIYDYDDDGDDGNGEAEMDLVHMDPVRRAHLSESGEGRRTGLSVLPGQMWCG